MTRMSTSSVAASVLLLGLATSALAATGEYENMDAMALAQGKTVKTDCSISSQLDGKTYCFGSQPGHEPIHAEPQAQSLQGSRHLYEQALSEFAASQVARVTTARSDHRGGPLHDCCHATGVPRRATRSRASVSRVERSAQPSMRAGLKWRWKASTTFSGPVP